MFTGLLLPVAGDGCFGSKLFIGLDGSVRQETLYALVSIYIKEKTGTETVAVYLDGATPAEAVTKDRADLVFCENIPPAGRVVFKKEEIPFIVSGERPQSDLQFTLVIPALKKLSGLLPADDFSSLVQAVASGAPPLATAREFLDSRGWL
ncbi:hypothetical protein C2E25_10210 [Geothermobacter hydrogeniphilus]|uniref:ABC-type glycine betaine transport system substrate-binding domain-containing protein n=1 Tax=Geothermobacter hydrogeniphilus TaxID=1969733 RepID=A0A2K2H9H2_9BACT|nr:hypothetical protein [Geothermobacter hydrogeniphilus]PNU19911.1 hypothetical protein C2E25_10210 [Geothermobacter hydrogeniphilus]